MNGIFEHEHTNENFYMCAYTYIQTHAHGRSLQKRVSCAFSFRIRGFVIAFRLFYMIALIWLVESGFNFVNFSTHTHTHTHTLYI